MRPTPTLEELTKQYHKALEQHPEIAKEKARQDAVSGNLGTAAANAMRENEAEGITPELHSSGLETISNPETSQNIETAFDLAKNLYERINLEIPTPDDFAEAGVDFKAFALAVEQMEKQDKQPQVIISPSLSLDQWTKLYDNLTKDSNIKDNPLRSHDRGNGLRRSDSAKNIVNATESNNNPNTIGAITKDTSIHIYTDANDISWTISAIPTMEEPEARGQTYQDILDDPKQGPKVLPTMHEYLSLQASRITNQQPPMNPNTSTWLRDNDGSRALIAGWGPDDGRVFVGGSSFGGSSVSLGLRPPVWG